MRVTRAEAHGSMYTAVDKLQMWHENSTMQGLQVPDINSRDFRLAQELLYRLSNDVQLDHRLVVQLADHPVEAHRITDFQDDSISIKDRWLKPRTQLQLTETSLFDFPHGKELYIGTKAVKVAASAIARVLYEGGRLNILRQEQAKGITAKFTKFNA